MRDRRADREERDGRCSEVERSRRLPSDAGEEAMRELRIDVAICAVVLALVLLVRAVG